MEHVRKGPENMSWPRHQDAFSTTSRVRFVCSSSASCTLSLFLRVNIHSCWMVNRCDDPRCSPSCRVGGRCGCLCGSHKLQRVRHRHHEQAEIDGWKEHLRQALQWVPTFFFSRTQPEEVCHGFMCRLFNKCNNTGITFDSSLSLILCIEKSTATAPTKKKTNAFYFLRHGGHWF